LHQGEQSFLHASTATGAETNKGQVMINTGFNTTHESFANNRAHRTTHKTEFKYRDNDRHRFNGALQHH